MSYENCSQKIFDGEGRYDIPIIKPVRSYSKKDWLSFEKIRGSGEKIIDDFEKKNIGIHFFHDDPKFEVVWARPLKHIERLRKYGYVLSPDFSMYTNFPKAVQIMQTYKRHWVARFWQENGVKVIPTICWSTPDTYDFCFDGEPKDSVVAVSDIGCSRKYESRKLFRRGYAEMMARLKPRKVLFFTYGAQEKRYDGDVVYINIKKEKNFER